MTVVNQEGTRLKCTAKVSGCEDANQLTSHITLVSVKNIIAHRKQSVLVRIQEPWRSLTMLVKTVSI